MHRPNRAASALCVLWDTLSRLCWLSAQCTGAAIRRGTCGLIRTAQMYICEAFLVDKVYRAVPDQNMLPGQVRLCYSNVDDNRAA
jgi:hypothetical protein